MNVLEKAGALLPARERQALLARSGDEIEELRLRVGQPITVLCAGREQSLCQSRVTEELLERLLETATGASIHAAAPALASGFLSYRGLRIGLCGTAIIRDGCFVGLRNLSSAAIRLPKACRGVCDDVLEELWQGGFPSTLVAAPPGGGKTTALRELIRLLSGRGVRVAVVDERNELLARDRDGSGFDLGPCSDVLCGCEKGEGAMLLLRAMNPQIIAMDEISKPSDMRAVEEIAGCGVRLLASIHAGDRQELQGRELGRRLLEKRIFRSLVVISGQGSRRRYRVERL